MEANTVTVKVTARVIECCRAPGPGPSTSDTFIFQYVQFNPIKQADDYLFMGEGAGTHRGLRNLPKVLGLGSVGAKSVSLDPRSGAVPEEGAALAIWLPLENMRK